jgi:predicted methyltransferase
MNKIVVLITLLLVSSSVWAEEASFSDRIKTAMQAEIRGESDTDRDRNRKPVDTLQFMGIENGMRVLELFPGGGWYTKLLAPALQDNGEYMAALGTSRIKERLTGKPGFEQMNVLEVDAKTERTEMRGVNSISEFSFGVDGVDAVLTFRNMHNFSSEARGNINRAVFQALKPGGVYGVVDHTRRHNAPLTLESRRRADPVAIIKELLDAGFEFAGHSDLHYRPDDELRYEVGRKTVTGNTDRFTFLFRKPE